MHFSEMDAENLCPVCNKALPHGVPALTKHLRILHGKDFLESDFSTLSREDQKSFIKSLPNLPKLKLGRKASALGDWGRCDCCAGYSARRWCYPNSTRGEVTVCVNCRQKLLGRSAGDVYSSKRILPGSYGGAK